MQAQERYIMPLNWGKLSLATSHLPALATRGKLWVQDKHFFLCLLYDFLMCALWHQDRCESIVVASHSDLALIYWYISWEKLKFMQNFELFFSTPTRV